MLDGDDRGGERFTHVNVKLVLCSISSLLRCGTQSEEVAVVSGGLGEIGLPLPITVNIIAADMRAGRRDTETPGHRDAGTPGHRDAGTRPLPGRKLLTHVH
ncbi:hypothetical protein JOB18_025257 [Solea senegalensis]|uniref:Uncharacterized protein n=1 Tax=Solea senegalensis TaxID=28829 RepID=A0AAV6Q2Q8_SOLSE|nr:hypothetical protein JOB18_025257 [Solea senegalensis]